MLSLQHTFLQGGRVCASHYPARLELGKLGGRDDRGSLEVSTYCFQGKENVASFSWVQQKRFRTKAYLLQSDPVNRRISWRIRKQVVRKSWLDHSWNPDKEKHGQPLCVLSVSPYLPFTFPLALSKRQAPFPEVWNVRLLERYGHWTCIFILPVKTIPSGFLKPQLIIMETCFSWWFTLRSLLGSTEIYI